MQAKIRLLSAIFLILFFGLVARLFYWQIVKGASLSREAKLQHNSSKVTLAPRGNVLAQDGSYWTIRTDAWLVFANSSKFKGSSKEVAEKLAPFFIKNPEKEENYEALLAEIDRVKALLEKKGAYIPLRSRLDSSTKKNIEAMKIPGIEFEVQEGRFYPEASSAAQLLGFVGKDESGGDVGYFGLEGYYNLALSGKSGFVGQEKDAKGVPILINRSQRISAISGVNLVTSIDKRIQILIEDKLKEGVEKYGAVSGSITIMDPKDGRILGLAAYPSFDPANYRDYNDSLFKNPVISNAFEPGSIFKVLVMAAGLDAGVIEPDTKCDICGAPLKLDKYFIKTWNNEYHEDITMTNVIVNSDNVGMSFIGARLGTEKMYEYLDKFGFGHTTGVDLQGEVSSRLREKGTWSVVDLATASFGQGVAVTGMQMVRAVSAIANKGYLPVPKVVEKLAGDGWEEEVKTEKPVRVLSEKAAWETTQMMAEAASHGESKWTNLKGFKVAGKTGTAQIPVAGHYDATNTNHSFIGFAPYDNPKFIMLVTLQSPQSSPWASETAAPLWYSVGSELFPYLGIHPEK